MIEKRLCLITIFEVMQLNKTKLFIGISTIALAILVFIQVEWIIQSAKIKEELFNEKATMVLSKTVEELCSDTEMCERFGECNSSEGMKECKLMLSHVEINRIDSLLKQNMTSYHFHIDYSFELIKPNKAAVEDVSEDTKRNIFKKRLEEVVNKNGLELKLVFPDKKQFIIAEMGSMFISSILLIVIILIFFWITIRSLWKEKMISQHTTDFLNNMTHEFKTPLANISLASKMITKEPNISNAEKIKYYTSIILDENEKLLLQVEQVLSMTALERGEIPIVKAEINLGDVIENAVKCMRIQLEAKEGSLKLNLKAERLMIFGDKNHLVNTICNLIDNAIKYAKEKPEIEISTANKDNNIIIKISDNGIGINKNYLDKVFDKFFRVPTGDIHNVKGFGLGLAYVKRIIELHNGAIELESAVDQGSTFKITLPLVQS